jgi:hypothetical protein
MKKNPYLFGCYLKRFRIDEFYDNFIKHYHPEKRSEDNPRGAYEFYKTFPPFVLSVLGGEIYTDEELESLPYFDYLVKHLHPGTRDPLTPKGKRHAMEQIKGGISLINDIKNNGMNIPIDVYKNNGELIIKKGDRRIVILKHLKCKWFVGRVFRNFKKCKKAMKILGGRDVGFIGKVAFEQFTRDGFASTDKYWCHDYIHCYDTCLVNLRNRRIRILEIGVKRGASLLLWKKAFPKAKVFGVDKEDVSNAKILRKNKDLKLFVGDQTDVKFLKTVIKEGPFDLIVDDGSHIPQDILISLETLWPSMASQGWYVIEDVWFKEKYVEERPVLMNRVAKMINDMCLRNDVCTVAFYPNICFIQKNG